MAVSTINNALVPINFARGSIKSGSVAGDGTAVAFNVTFDTPMASTPTIVASITQIGSFRLYVAYLRDITVNGFTVALRNDSGSALSLTANRRIDWIAACD